MSKGCLTLFCSCLLTCDNAVGDGADGKGTITATGSIHVESGNFHLYSQHSHVDPLVGTAVLIIEGIGGEYISYTIFVTKTLTCLCSIV